jgi:propanediol dehydratase large subunit
MSQFSFNNIGHFFATVAADIVKGARAAASIMSKAEKIEPEVEALTGLLFPQAVEVERAGFLLLGMAAQAIIETGDAAAAKGANITLDRQLVADIKALIQAIEQYAKTMGVAKPAAGATAGAAAADK